MSLDTGNILRDYNLNEAKNEMRQVIKTELIVSKETMIKKRLVEFGYVIENQDEIKKRQVNDDTNFVRLYDKVCYDLSPVYDFLFSVLDTCFSKESGDTYQFPDGFTEEQKRITINLLTMAGYNYGLRLTETENGFIVKLQLLKNAKKSR